MVAGLVPCGHPSLTYHGGGFWECAVCQAHVDPHELG